MGVIREEVAKYEETIKARIDQELTAERQKLVTQIDTKLADAVASFLNETLQHNVDLGGQTEYLLSMLEEHKADFIREVGSDETKSAA
jgi:antitoxin component of RelBE/YafQ-DinJ toxin-antitoxin module